MGWLIVSIIARGEGPEAEIEGRDSSLSLLDLMPLLFLCLFKVTTATTTKMRAVTMNAASELAVTRGVAVERLNIIFHMQLYQCFKFFKSSALSLYLEFCICACFTPPCRIPGFTIVPSNRV